MHSLMIPNTGCECLDIVRTMLQIPFAEGTPSRSILAFGLLPGGVP